MSYTYFYTRCDTEMFAIDLRTVIAIDTTYIFDRYRLVFMVVIGSAITPVWTTFETEDDLRSAYIHAEACWTYARTQDPS